jgi:Mn-dependent DtxR family transcriptional regulator
VTDLPFADLLLAQLGRGADHATTYGELTDRLRVSRRKVERGVQELRLRGWLVISDDRGCWLSFEASEGREQYRRLRSRYIHQAQTARAVLRTANAIDRTQMRLW